MWKITVRAATYVGGTFVINGVTPLRLERRRRPRALLANLDGVWLHVVTAASTPPTAAATGTATASPARSADQRGAKFSRVVLDDATACIR
jgi:hypothetical protein